MYLERIVEKVKRINKKLASAVVLGLLMAMPFGANAAEQTINTDSGYDASESHNWGGDGDNVIITGSNGNTIINTNGGSGMDVTFGNAGTVTATGAWINNAFLAGGNHTVTVSNIGSLTVQDTVDQKTFAFQGYNGTVKVENVDNVTLTDVHTGLQAQVGEGNNLGNGVVDFDLKGDLNITAHVGIIAADYNSAENADSLSASVDVNANNVTITRLDGPVGNTGANAAGTKYDNNFAVVSVSEKYNLDKENDRTPDTAGKTSVSITANTITIDADSDNDDFGAILAANGKEKAGDAGVSLTAADKIDIAGDIVADKNALIDIGAAEGKEDTYTATIKGDITSKGTADNRASVVNIALGQNGSLTGAVSDDNVTEEGGVTDSTKGVALNMGNGSVWNVTGDKTSTVSTLKGTGTIALDVKEDATVNGGVTVGHVDDKADLTVAAQQTADDIQSSEKALQNMAGATKGLSEGTVFKIDEGILKGGSTGILEADNKLGSITTDDSTSTMGNMKSLASVAILSWRQEDSTFSQRLGDLRETKDGQGIWARMSRGEFEYKSEFKNQYNYFQIGYDKAFGSWHYGAAISYNDGETSYAEGYGENDSTSLSLYGTWLGDRGQYTDIVLKEGRLNNKYTNHAAAGTTSADYDMWGTSISAEYGQKLDLQDGWFVTPQAQLTYMRIGSENYTAQVTTAAGTQSMQVRQDALDSFVGRIGLEAGKSFSDKGSFYAKASLLHEFAGDADTYLNLNGLSNSYSQDLGDTWYEAGFGINYKLTDSSYLYADVVRTFGGDIDTPWQWNLGMRFSV